MSQRDELRILVEEAHQTLRAHRSHLWQYADEVARIDSWLTRATEVLDRIHRVPVGGFGLRGPKKDNPPQTGVCEHCRQTVVGIKTHRRECVERQIADCYKHMEWCEANGIHPNETVYT